MFQLNSIQLTLQYFSALVTMSCFHESCNRNAKFWCQNCSPRFCDDCINQAHHKDATTPSIGDSSNPEPSTTTVVAAHQLDPTAIGNCSKVQCSQAANWLAIVGVHEDIVICHFCDQYEQIDRIVSHCRCKRHLKRVRQFYIEQQQGR